MTRALESRTGWWQQLPFPYTECRVTEGSRPDGFRFYPHIINIEAELFGRRFIVCGEAESTDLAMTKAVAELLERSALFGWINQGSGRMISSNGWAAHSTIESAKAAAILELIERDAVLAQWYTTTPFQEIPNHELPFPIRLWQQKELSRSEFPILKVLLSSCGLGPSVTCLLMNKEGFGVSSHATRNTLAESIDSALAEACRAAHLSLRKAFWKDTIALRDRSHGPVEPGAHAVYYAYHEPFPDWMFGPAIGWDAACKEWIERITAIPQTDFSFEVVLDAPAVVGFVKNCNALDLRWGPTDLELVLKTDAGKRLVAKTLGWNLKPHIIS
jgi:YcaO cyclodehydratase, ATP-ad Mg2+-binding